MSVRANLHLDERAFEYIHAYAHGKGIPLGAAVSEIVLDRAENASKEETVLAPPEFRQTEQGYWVRARKEGGLVITPELVKELSEDEFEY